MTLGNPINTSQGKHWTMKMLNIEKIHHDRWVFLIWIRILTWQFPCLTRRWVWQLGGCIGSCGCRFSQWRQRSWGTFLWPPQQASFHIVQLKKAQLIHELNDTLVSVCLRHKSPLTVLLHAQGDAALQPAVLAAVAVQLIDGTLSGSPTRVHQVLPDAALEESFAAFTADRPIVTPWARGTWHLFVCPETLMLIENNVTLEGTAGSYLRPYRHIRHSIPQQAWRYTVPIPLSQTRERGEHNR